MRLSFFADSRFVTDGEGNYYSSSNVRRAMLYPIADRCERLYLVVRLSQGDLSAVPQEDLINHPKIEFVGVPVFRGIIGSVLMRRKIMRTIRYAVEQADVCVLRLASNVASMAAGVVREMGRPSIGHVVGAFDMELRRNHKHVPLPGLRQLVAAWTLRRNRAALRSCDIVCGVTEAVAREYAQPGREVRQLVDSCLSPECYSPPRSRQSGRTRAVFAGRLVEFKNVQNFLKAARELKNEGIEIDITIVGEGDFKPKLIELSQSLGLRENVEFCGRIESRGQLWNKYREADIGFILSFSEGLPLGAIEPMSVGLPLIASDLDYMKPVITNGVEGFLVDPYNVETIARQLKLLATDGELRQKMAMAAYERAKAFSAESQAEKLLSMAKELVEHEQK